MWSEKTLRHLQLKEDSRPLVEALFGQQINISDNRCQK